MDHTPVAVVLHQPAKTLGAVKQQVFVPFIVDAFHRDPPPEITDGVVIRRFQRPVRTQRDQRFVANPRLELRQDTKIRVGEVEDRAARAAGHGFAEAAGAKGQGAAATGALTGLRLNVSVGFPAERRNFAQPGQLQVVKWDLLADKRQWRGFTVIERGEPLASALQVNHRRVIAGANLDG